MIQITIGGGCKLESTEADVVESLVINTERLVRVFNQLVDRESRVVRLDDGIRNLQPIVIQCLARKQDIRGNRP
jgi:hypothetical protein